jgi:VWFA-related protein
MRNTRVALLALAALFAPAFSQESNEDFVIRESVTEVVAPVTVTDRDGSFVNGLEARDFRLFDNTKLQKVDLNVMGAAPISLVVAIQANTAVEYFMRDIKAMGPLLDSLVVGETGEVAILAFDHRMQWLQDFTDDGDLINKALEKIRIGSRTSAMIDAVFEGTRKLSNRPSANRRVLLLISETRDRGSEGRLREALLSAQVNDVAVYTVNVNRLVTKLTEESEPPRPDPLPPGSRPRFPGAPMTPQATAQVGGLGGNSANFTPVFVEILTQIKSVFIDNPAEVLTQYTGGREYSFINRATLERVLTDLGEELHSQYLLSYNPNNLEDGGWHEITVQVMGRGANLEVRTRPGYWTAARPQ